MEPQFNSSEKTQSYAQPPKKCRKKNIALIVSGIIFGLMAIIHFLRVYFQIGISISYGVFSGLAIPMGVSLIGSFISLTLSIWMFVASKGHSR